MRPMALRIHRKAQKRLIHFALEVHDGIINLSSLVLRRPPQQSLQLFALLLFFVLQPETKACFSIQPHL